MKNEQSKDVVIALTDKQVESVKKAIKSAKSLYQNFKALLESDLVIRELFLTKTCKEIVVIVYGENALNDNEYALTENRNRTAFGNALHNLKKFAKSQYCDNASNDKPPRKKAVNVMADLDNLRSEFLNYSESDRNSILHHLDQLNAYIKSVTKK